MRKLTLLLLGVFLAACQRVDVYQPISSIEEAEPFLENLSDSDLVIWDVDYTLLTPQEMLGRPNAAEMRQALFYEFKLKHGEKAFQKMLSEYFLQRRVEEIVEPETREVIYRLQRKGIPTMALTAIGAHKFGVIKDPMILRVEALRAQGISFFSARFPEKILWDKNSGYFSGVLFAGKRSKGEILMHFLKYAQITPHLVIHIDDDARHLKSVQDACVNAGIYFKGFLYKSSNFDLDPDPNEYLIRRELDHLLETTKWRGNLS